MAPAVGDEESTTAMTRFATNIPTTAQRRLPTPSAVMPTDASVFPVTDLTISASLVFDVDFSATRHHVATTLIAPSPFPTATATRQPAAAHAQPDIDQTILLSVATSVGDALSATCAQLTHTAPPSCRASATQLGCAHASPDMEFRRAAASTVVDD